MPACVPSPPSQAEIRNQCVFNAVLHLVFAAVPPLWTKVSYFFPIACVSMMLAAHKALSTWSKKKKKPTPGSRTSTTASSKASVTQGSDVGSADADTNA